MYVFLAILTSISALTIVFAGILSILQNSKSPENRWFFVLTLVLAIWIPVNFIDSNVTQEGITRLLVQADYSLALVIGLVMLEFAAALIGDGHYKWRGKLVSLPRAFLFRLCAGGVTLLLIESVFKDFVFTVSIANDQLLVAPQQFFYPYAIILCGYFIYALAIIKGGYKSATGNARRGLDLIFSGFFIAFITNVFSNLIFPNIIDARTVVKDLNIIGYIGIVIFVGCIYVAITKRRLFDIRFIAVRGAVYLVTLATVSTIYIAPLLYITDRVIPGPEMSLPVFITVLVFMSVAAALYESIRKIFNKSTNRLFFQDAYDSEKFIAELNQAVVSTLDLDSLLNDATDVIARNMKAEYCLIGLRSSASSPRRVAGTVRKNFTDKDINLIRKELPALKTRIVVTDLVEDRHTALLSSLKKNNIAMIGRLVREAADDDERLGYLVLGPKKNGSTYNVQDTRIIETVINGLIVAIQNSLRFEEIQNFNITLQQRVEDRTRQLQRTNEKLKALDETKDDFISMASHQLRTPLTAVKGYLSMVLEGDAGKITPVQKKMLGQAFMSSQHMVFLIADLLNVSRLKTGKFVIEAAPLNLAHLIQEEIGQLRETAASRSLQLVYEKPKNFPSLMLDETKTRQVVMNFIDNAIHYTQSGGTVTVELHNKQQTVELVVRDTGIGVPKSEQPHLFTKFYRAANARRERPDGTGLGLFMAKKVVVAQGGAILFSSKENAGSSFGFTLPKAKLLAPIDKTAR